MPKTKVRDVMCPDGMISLDEKQHLEMLESIGQRVDKAKRKYDRTKDDEDLAVFLELMEIYFQCDVESTPEIRALRKKYPLEEALKELRAPQICGRSRG